MYVIFIYHLCIFSSVFFANNCPINQTVNKLASVIHIEGSGEGMPSINFSVHDGTFVLFFLVSISCRFFILSSEHAVES